LTQVNINSFIWTNKKEGHSIGGNFQHGTDMDPAKQITYKGRVKLHEDQATRDWGSDEPGMKPGVQPA